MYRIETLPLTDLYLDNSYKRVPVEETVQKIVAEFFEPACAPLNVNKRADGNYYVMDGAYRLHVLVRLGYTEFPCMVSEGLAPQEEASIFAKSFVYWND